MILVGATHKYMDVRHQFKVEDFDECVACNKRYWRDFEVVGSERR